MGNIPAKQEGGIHMLHTMKNFGWLAGSVVLALFSTSVDAGEVQCWPPPQVFPPFDRSCQDEPDCRVAVHQVDCCGTRSALGINYLEQDRFNEAETICEPQYPRCGCPDRGIFADDGNSTYEVADLGVFCSDGSCSTFVIPEK
jgi:hypothetical protein